MGDGGRRTEDRGATSAPYRFRVFRGSILCAFAFFAAEDFTLLNQFYSSPDSSRRASFRAGFLRVSSTAYTFTKPSDSL